jgi:glycosyltransferase involved in cell wall biosynthesis
VERKVARLKLRGAVVFAGARPDVPRLMRGAMDLFVLPSLFEGLPLVGIEAQAAGLPCVFSDTITPEVDALPPLVSRLSLTRGASAWADAILGRLARRPAVTPGEALEVLRRSSFNIENSVRALERFYEEQRVSL